jgi:hypothetical protein
VKLPTQPQPKPNWSGLALLALANLIAVSFFYSPGTGDVSIWNNWMREISSSGLIGGYAQSDTDYPPLAFVLLAAVSRGAAAFGIAQFLVLKFSLLIFLLATAACFYWFTRNLILTAALELALMLNSMGLAYLDIYFAPFLIAGLFHLQRGNSNRGLILFAISCFTKWQPLISLRLFWFTCLTSPENAHPKITESKCKCCRSCSQPAQSRFRSFSFLAGKFSIHWSAP